VNALAPRFEADAGSVIRGEFGAVGAMAAKLRSGTPADLLILTSELISTLIREGHAASGSSADIGVVQTAVAIRDGSPQLAVGDAAELRTALLASDAIYVPDPQQATAGIHFAKVLRSLGIRDETAPRLRVFPNGATAMRELASSRSERPIGCTQATEILSTPGVVLIGPLPEGCALATTYTAAVAANAACPNEARRFLQLLTGEATRDIRRAVGFSEN
jgi:molybdate transport system substrate-binding protein